MENLFDIIRKLLEEYSDSIENPNDFSMSYSYTNGMDKPEFKINGKNVNPELLKKLEQYMMDFGSDFSNFQTFDQSFLNNSNAFHRKVTIPNKISGLKPEINEKAVKDIFYDIFDEGEKLKIIIELPGVNKDDIQLEATANEIEIKTPSRYETIQLPVPVNNNIAKARYTNGILDIELEKIVQSKKKKKKLQIN